MLKWVVHGTVTVTYGCTVTTAFAVSMLFICTVTGALRTIIKYHKYKMNEHDHFDTDKCVVVCAILV